MTTHGRNTYFAVEDSAGSTLRNISIYVTSVDYNRGQDTHDNTTYGKSGHTHTNGLATGTFTVNGFWDKTASTGAATVLDSLIGVGAVGYEYGPEGNTNGNVKYSGEAVMQSVVYSSPVADLVSFVATFVRSDVDTKGTFSA